MIEVREINENEIKDVAHLEAEIFSDAWSEQSVQETFEQKHAIILGAWKDSEFAGYAIFYYVLDEGEIARIASASFCRRQGVAGEIFKALLKACDQKNITRIMLDVRQSNEAAIAFYKKCGFSEDGVRKNFYDVPKENAVLMSMDTASSFL